MRVVHSAEVEAFCGRERYEGKAEARSRNPEPQDLKMMSPAPRANAGNRVAKSSSRFEVNLFAKLRDGCMSTSGSGINASTSLSSILRTKRRRRKSDEEP